MLPFAKSFIQKIRKKVRERRLQRDDTRERSRESVTIGGLERKRFRQWVKQRWLERGDQTERVRRTVSKRIIEGGLEKYLQREDWRDGQREYKSQGQGGGQKDRGLERVLDREKFRESLREVVAEGRSEKVRIKKGLNTVRKREGQGQ